MQIRQIKLSFHVRRALANAFAGSRVIRVFLFVFTASIFVYNSSKSQDLHFSQWFNSPLTTNPANTGFIPDADYRIGANYRSQYVNVLAAPYKTISIFADAQLLRDRFENAWLGVGGVILRD